MPPKRARPQSIAQQVTGLVILAILGLILIWLLLQQSRFNPAVVALEAPRPKVVAPGGLAAQPATAKTFPTPAGFSPSGPVQSFGPENLSDKINGKAELYLSAGFQSLIVQSFTLANPAGTYLEVFLYDMGKPQNAYAVFSSQRRPGATPLNFRPNAYATANAQFFMAGKFYVEMIMDRALPDVAAVLQPMTTALLADLPPEPASDGAVAVFPTQGLLPDSVRLNAADTCGMEGFNNVYTAEYQLPSGPATVFLAQRPGSAQASAEARRYQEFLQANGFRVVQDPKIPQGITVLASEDFFEVIMVVDGNVTGVHEAPSLSAALELALQMKQALTKSR